jgi:hypothetical protein
MSRFLSWSTYVMPAALSFQISVGAAGSCGVPFAFCYGGIFHQTKTPLLSWLSNADSEITTAHQLVDVVYAHKTTLPQIAARWKDIMVAWLNLALRTCCAVCDKLHRSPLMGVSGSCFLTCCLQSSHSL